MTIGVLALQGDFAEHIGVLHSLTANMLEVRTVQDLSLCDALIIPGGESTVMCRYLEIFGIGKPLMDRIAKGMPVYGTCAGAIVLARKALGKNAPKTLGAMDIDVDRNAYGAQIHSFNTTLKVTGIQLPVKAAFIRAPIIVRTGAEVEVLAREGEHPVLVRQGNLLAGTFHPEVQGETAVHKMFLRMIAGRK